MIASGNILISEPFLGDTNFERTVILVCEHNETGSIGFILNRPTEIIISSLVNDLIPLDTSVYLGGPVAQDSIHFIHRGKERIEGDAEVLKGVYWGGNFDELLYRLQNKLMQPHEVRFFLGYSGWGEGQLENELQRKSWIVGQVRIEGKISKVEGAISDKYFYSRPAESQAGAIASPQSQVIESRDFLERNYQRLMEEEKKFTRPDNWGGYILQADYYEFWQGRPGRLHDRIIFQLEEGEKWSMHRLAP